MSCKGGPKYEAQCVSIFIKNYENLHTAWYGTVWIPIQPIGTVLNRKLYVEYEPQCAPPPSFPRSRKDGGGERNEKSTYWYGTVPIGNCIYIRILKIITKVWNSMRASYFGAANNVAKGNVYTDGWLAYIIIHRPKMETGESILMPWTCNAWRSKFKI